MKPALDAAGVRLLCVGIGTPEAAAKFSETLPFPAECLYVDAAGGRAAHKALELYGDLSGDEGWFFDPKVVEGVRRLFFNDATSAAMKDKMETGSMKAVMKRYKPQGMLPKEAINTVQQGGLFVFRGREAVLEHKDEGTGVHADPAAVLQAATCARRA